MRNPTPAPHIYFSVGEPSGDLHGANLIHSLRELNPDIRCVGFGGPRMKRAGCELLFDLTQLAVMWIVRAILNIHRFIGLLCLANRYFREHRPDAVVLIDYPGFNWWVARRAKAHGIPVFYYGAPQLWAWAGWRVHKMRRLTDHVLCKLPFEPAWLQARECHATYVGHPYFDELAKQPLHSDRDSDPENISVLDGITHLKRTRRLVVILPGSRDQEVASNLAMFLSAAAAVHARYRDTCFVIASFNEQQAGVAREMLAKHVALPVQVVVNRTTELIQLADCCLACSGSVSLELLYHAKPSVIGYRLSRIAYWAQSKFRTVKYITLANLIASDDIYCRAGSSSKFIGDARKALFPEFVTCEDESDAIAEKLTTWLTNDSKRLAVADRLARLRQQHAIPGASQRAAEYIYKELSRKGSRRKEPSLMEPSLMEPSLKEPDRKSPRRQSTLVQPKRAA